MKVGLRKRSATATKNYIVETRQGPAPTSVPSEVQCKDHWYVGSLLDQAPKQAETHPKIACVSRGPFAFGPLNVDAPSNSVGARE